MHGIVNRRGAWLLASLMIFTATSVPTKGAKVILGGMLKRETGERGYRFVTRNPYPNVIQAFTVRPCRMAGLNIDL